MGKPLCVFLNKDVLSFSEYISLHSRKDAFVGVYLFSHNRMFDGELRMSIQNFNKIYNITWMGHVQTDSKLIQSGLAAFKKKKKS